MVSWFVDLSNHNAGIDVEQIAREGFVAAICKATEGTTYNDPQFTNYVSRARNAGMIPGAYHFLRSSSGVAQAQKFFARVKAVGGPTGMICVCDNETDATSAVTRDFYNEWNRLSGNHPLIMYSGAWWWGPRGWNGTQFTPYLWHSRYVSGSDYASSLYGKVPDSWWTPGYGGWSQATFLQFSSSGKVAGRTVDVNAFRGTKEQLSTFTRANTAQSGGNMSWQDGIDPNGKIAGTNELLIYLRHMFEAIANGGTPPGFGPNALVNKVSNLQTSVNELALRPVAEVVVTAEMIDKIRTGLADELAQAIISQMAPQLAVVTRMADKLDKAGQALNEIVPDA